jgi:hypothetical protein
MLTDAQLATHAAQSLKLATMNKKTEPHLLEGLQTVRDWSKKHHPGHGTTHAPTPNPAPAATK